MDKTPGCEIIPFPRARRLLVDGGRIAESRHAVHGLIEVDVTDARRIIHDHKARTGEAISFTAFVLVCLGKAVEAHKAVHACRDWRGRLAIFDEVNANTAFEIQRGEHKMHHARVIRAINRRTVRDLHDEIRAVQAGTQHIAGARGLKWFVRLPWPLRRVFYWTVMHTPTLQHRSFGTVSLTSVGMFGKGSGWAIPFPIAALSVALGGMAEKPWVVDGQIGIREILCVTLSFDHDIVDGAPAARFAGEFKALIEGCCGLDEFRA